MMHCVRPPFPRPRSPCTLRSRRRTRSPPEVRGERRSSPRGPSGPLSFRTEVTLRDCCVCGARRCPCRRRAGGCVSKFGPCVISGRAQFVRLGSVRRRWRWRPPKTRTCPDARLDDAQFEKSTKTKQKSA